MKLLIGTGIFLFALTSHATQIILEGCSSALSYDKFYGDCDGHPCGAKTIQLGSVIFNLTFDTNTKLGTGIAVATDLNGKTNSSAIQCHASQDRHWMDCESESAVLNGQGISISTNVNGIGTKEKPVYFLPIFLSSFNSLNGGVQTQDDCKSVTAN